MKLEKLHKIVKKVLEEKPEARKNDFRLYAEVLREFDFDLVKTSLHMFLFTAQYYDAPPFESVSRCRRKVQKEYPELKDTKTAKARQEKEQEYFEYSIS